MSSPSKDLETEMGESPPKARNSSTGTILGSMWEQILGFFKWTNLRRSLIQVGWAIMSIILALLVTSLIMLASGFNPIVAYSTLITGALLQPDLILWYTTPLILTGLSVALAFRTGLFNIGAEGQLYMGSMAAAVVGFMLILPIFIHPLLALFGSNYVSFGFIVGILCVIGVWILLKNTVLGYEMRAVGHNEAAAEAAGINPKKMIVIALFLSGCLAGLAGAVEILGYYHRFLSGWSQGLGFDGITVAVLGANSPMGVFLGALFFGFLRAGAIQMQVVGHVPAEMVDVIQGLVVLFVAAPKIVEWLARKEIAWAQWIQKEPIKSLPIFLGSLFALIGGMISLAMGASMFGTLMIFDLIPDLPTLILTDPFMAMYLALLATAIIFGIIGLFVFYGLLKTERRVLWGYFPLSILLIVLGIMNALFFGGTILIPMLVLGILGLVFAAWTYLLIVRQGVTYGGEP